MFAFIGKCQVFLFSVTAFAICAATVTDVEKNARQIVAQTTGAFADSFLKTVANGRSGNLISSPLSAQVVLAMAAYGADGTTATQMRTALHIPSDNELGQTGYKSLLQTLNATQGVELRLANKIYTSNQFPVKTTYKQLTATKFLSTCEEVDFNNPEVAASTINSWCEQQTNNRIKDVIAPNLLTPNTKLILLNAVYFKSRWANEFDPALTEDKPFHVNAQTTINIPTMYMHNSFRCRNLTDLGARFIEIPYEGEQLSMIIILPNEVDGLKRIQDNLHQGNLSASLEGAQSRDDVQLFLPKFKIESTLHLEETLQKLGMVVMFEDYADFSGISDIPLKVSKVVQKAFIEVNEQGSEAAAVTSITNIRMISHIQPEVFVVDRPFYYQIRYASLNLPIFTGLYLGPQ